MEHDLIDTLVRDARPIRPLALPVVRLARWCIAALLCLSAGVAWLRLRRDLGEVWATPAFLLQGVLLLTAAVTSAAGAFVLSVPGAERRWVTRWLPLLSAAAWGAWLVVPLAIARTSSGASWPRPAPVCAVEIAALGLAPGVLLFYLVRRAAPLRASWAGLLATLAAGALGALGSQFVCANDQPSHLFVWHFLPMAAIAAAGVALGRGLLRWSPGAPLPRPSPATAPGRADRMEP